jgi:hypothetical protein
MSRPNIGLRPRAGPYLAGMLAVVALGAAACGSGTGGSAAQVSIRASLRSGCPASKAHREPFHGRIVFSTGNGHGLVARLDRRGRAHPTLAPGRYRVAVSGRPLVRGLVRARLDGRVLPVAAGGRFPVTVRRGDQTLQVVVAVAPTDCNALGTAG